jgi:hypothetical protein
MRKFIATIATLVAVAGLGVGINCVNWSGPDDGNTVNWSASTPAQATVNWNGYEPDCVNWS